LELAVASQARPAVRVLAFHNWAAAFRNLAAAFLGWAVAFRNLAVASPDWVVAFRDWASDEATGWPMAAP